MTKISYDFDRYIKLVEAFRDVRESALESAKIERDIRKTTRENERLELERKKQFINDFIDIGKFLIKLGATGILAALALSNAGLTRDVLLWVSVAGAGAGSVFLFVGIKFRSSIEEDYISEIAKISKTYDESLEPLVEYTAAIKNEAEVLNEMVKLEQKMMIESYPEMEHVILGDRK